MISKREKKIIFSRSLSCFRLWSVKFLWRCFFIFIFSNHLRHTHGSQNAKSQIKKKKKKRCWYKYVNVITKHVQLYYIYPSFGCSVERFSFWRCTPSDPRWQSGYIIYSLPKKETLNFDMILRISSYSPMSVCWSLFLIVRTIYLTPDYFFLFFSNKNPHRYRSFVPNAAVLHLFIYYYFLKIKAISYLYPIMFHFHYIYTSFCLATSSIILITSHVSLSLSLSIARRLFVFLFRLFLHCMASMSLCSIFGSSNAVVEIYRRTILEKKNTTKTNYPFFYWLIKFNSTPWLLSNGFSSKW